MRRELDEDWIEPRAHLERAFEDLQERYLAAIDPDRISVRRAGLFALLRTVDTGGFWSGDLGITYPAGSDQPVEDSTVPALAALATTQPERRAL